MAFLEDLKITGTLGNLSFYYMRGVDKIVVRQKGGASREHIKKSPSFELPRLYMSEFGGCSKMGKEVRFMMHPVRNLADYNFSGFINKALKIVQKQDSMGKLGRRSIELSRHTSLLAGFQLNKTTTFDSVVRTPLRYTLSRETRSARVDIPALLRDINFHPNNRHARFRFEVSLGIVPDFTFDAGDGIYKPRDWYTTLFTPRSVSSPWYPALKGSPATSLEINLTDQVPADEGYSLMLTVGVRYGSPMEDDVVTEVKRAGVGKVIAVAGQPDGVETPGSEKVTREEPVRPVADVQGGVAACMYGWRSGKAIPSPGQLAKIETAVSTSGEKRSSSEETEEPVVTEDLIPAPAFKKPAPGLKAHTSLPLQEHDDPGGDGDDQQQRPDVNQAEE
ncbi:hypothetical protein [Dawidia soli]|uniref:Uncharacterized protein n=1 Tax=Dawidia soli TaxID=2782352 RepID=A0AAP2DGM9_9BACT|nr:hypothetical protein [Dawidia soli]MBT1690355.1 hypothetical protein [Dawidia soli]